ncbi:uncharacterized protein LOC121272890 [Carcharodon carcharias]|uniref:uncharacterized protein LOC121272890 n=1 Tax=Carcharodon carcharias TaxID=13397 RepID=UPI001B7E30F5|nr:uncharacterized protein LOC121272890 [Carcharodon carcharias]
MIFEDSPTYNKAKSEELHPGTKAHLGELRQGDKAQPGELRPGTKAQPGELHPGTKAQPGELRPGTKAQPGELCPGTKAQPGELHPGTKAQPGELRPGTKAQPGELRPGTKAQPGELRPGTKAQPGELRPGTKAQSAELRPGTKAQSAELCPGSKAQPDMRAPKNITSFHELAQKRRQSAAGQPATKAKEDKSDWLMAFSPDNELPPPPKALLQEQAGAVLESQDTWRQQKAVITFRELRYRNHMGRWSDTRCGPTHPAMRDSAQQGSEAGNQTPRTAAAKGSGKKDREGQSANTGSTHGKTLSEAARGISDGAGTGQPRGQDLFGEPQCSADQDSSQDTAGRLSTRTFLRAERVKGQSEARAEELDGGSDRTRGKADGRDKTIKEAFASLFPRIQRPNTLQLQPFHLCLPADRNPLSPGIFRQSATDRHWLHSSVASVNPVFPQTLTALCPLNSTPLGQPLYQELQPRCRDLPPPEKSEVSTAFQPDNGPYPAVLRPSPVGAYSPPQRGSLPQLDTPDHSCLWSPFFPRSRTFPADPPRIPSHFPRQGSATRSRGAWFPLGLHFGIISPKPHPPSCMESCFRRNMRWNCHGTEAKGAGYSIWNIGIGRSRSLPGRTRTEWCGMASTAMTPSLHTPLLEGSVPSDSPQQKRGLLWPVNVAVDKIVSNFSVARNIVQKAQLGDSRVNPSVGRLVLGDLCPALYTVLHDGLNLYQQDLILGRRPNSPWSVVEASVKAGPSLKPLYSLYYQLDQFSQLNNSQKKFNAFIFGLLNLKRLDFWISCLHSCREVLRTHYSPMAFLSLSHSSCRALFEELLLLLQPLSVFTFHLDPLFEYHHQFLADQGVLGSDPQLRGLDQNERHTTQPGGTQQRQGGLPMAASGQPPEGEEGLGTGLVRKSQPQGSSDRAEQLGHRREAAAEEARDREAAQGARAGRSPSAQERQGVKAEPGYTLQQTFDQVMQWGDRLAQTLGDLHKPPAVVQPEPWTVPACSPPELVTGEAAAGVKRKPSWWDQLSQSSQVYLSTSQDSSAFAKWIKPKTTGSKTNSLSQPSAPKQESTGGTMAQERSRQVDDSVRVESAPRDTDHTRFNADGTGSPGPVTQKDSRDAANRKRSPGEQQDPAPCRKDPSDKLEEATLPATSPNGSPMASRSDLDGKAAFRLGDRLWLGRLFGAKVPCAYSPSDQPHREAQEGRRGRLPSDWLQVNMTHFEQLFKVILVGKERSPQLTEINPPSQETSKSTRKVRTLCDHTATDEDHLSFRRGDTLEILACVNEDWIRCCHGDVIGLVPIGYTSLI